MNPLLVTAFFDIGRGEWPHLARATETYVERFRAYGARLDAPIYLVAEQKIVDQVGALCDEVRVASLADMPASRFLDRTRDVIAGAPFRAMFRSKEDKRHVEHIHAPYNIAMLAKFDVLRMAARDTDYRHSHYIWVDFGASHRGSRGEEGPVPSVTPRDTDEITVVGKGMRRLWSLRRASLVRYIARFRVRIVGNLLVVPVARLEAFTSLIDFNYALLLDMGLTTDDQTLLDMAELAHPRLFRVARAPSGGSPFAFTEKVLAGIA